MNYREELSDHHKRLDALERRLAEKEAEIAKMGTIPPHQRKRIDELYAKARASRQRLRGSEESTWSSMRHEFEADWEALSAGFRHWLKLVDEEYRQRER